MNEKLQSYLIDKSMAMLDVTKGKFQHFSFICNGSRIICGGCNNMSKTHPMAAKYNREFPFIHSELGAILKFPHKPSELAQYFLYNIRIGKSKRILLSRPCRHCQNLIMTCGIKRVFYTNEYGYFEEFIYKKDKNDIKI